VTLFQAVDVGGTLICRLRHVYKKRWLNFLPLSSHIRMDDSFWIHVLPLDVLHRPKAVQECSEGGVEGVCEWDGQGRHGEKSESEWDETGSLRAVYIMRCGYGCDKEHLRKVDVCTIEGDCYCINRLL